MNAQTLPPRRKPACKLTFHVERGPHYLLVAIGGEASFDQAEVISAQLIRIPLDAYSLVVFDLAELTFLSSHGRPRRESPGPVPTRGGSSACERSSAGLVGAGIGRTGDVFPAHGIGAAATTAGHGSGLAASEARTQRVCVRAAHEASLRAE